MFCQKCGNAMAATATECGTCHAPVPSAKSQAAAAGVAVAKAASKDAIAALKLLALNPVAGLLPAYEALGTGKALRTGIALGVASLLCFLVGGYFLQPAGSDIFDLIGFGGFMKALLFGAMPFVCTLAGSLGARKALGGQGALGGDAFIAGAAVLPFAAAMLLAPVVIPDIDDFDSMETATTMTTVLTTLAGSFAILMLFAGYTKITKLTERAASLAVPIVLLLTMWIVKWLAGEVLMSSDGGFGGGGGYGF